ncbi:UNVERIFIED_CONTAM: hypothetical protein GTU68_040010, partial [Idotea baltica]|nr:hypothetical protein [Idotea baltica]
MLFTSTEFALLLAITFGLFYTVGSRALQVGVLLIASVVFYAWSSLSLTVLLLASALTTTTISYYLLRSNDPIIRKKLAVFGVVLNLSVLAFFKYAGLFTYSIQNLLDRELSGAEWLMMIPLPIGISFYTFQGISMLVDSFRNCSDGELQLEEGVFFVIFFPQLVAGPVVKAKDFLPQISLKYFSAIRWKVVIHCVITGFFLKMVVANNLQNQTFWIQYPQIIGMTADRCWILLVGYSCQIYADFAGYSLIAIGVAALFGYRLPKNFNFPYIATSISDFWRRWHISLSSWLKDYLYIPLGGNRKGSIRTYVNLLIVMTLGGLWHGAAWSYLIWGAFHGILLAVERA